MRQFIDIVETAPWNPKGIDPALMTFQEYRELVDPQRKSHPETAYDWTLTTLNTGEIRKTKADYPTVVRRLRINGIAFEVRMRAEAIKYRVPGDEAAALGLQPEEFSFAAFDEDDQIAAVAQDEWGTVLVAVVREYRGFGLGPIMTRIAYHYEPGKNSGGFTANGYRTFVKAYREEVRDALVNGRYRDLIRSGEITLDRVKEIIASARLDVKSKKPPEVNLSARDPKDWLLFNSYGEFTVYDRKLKDVIDDSRYDHFADRMIIGSVLVEGPEEHGLIVRFGGPDKVKRFLMECALAYCKNEGIALYVDPEDVVFVDGSKHQIGEADMKSGYRRHRVVPDKTIDVRGMVAAEKRWRRRFDVYDDFKNSILERAYAKFRA